MMRLELGEELPNGVASTHAHPVGEYDACDAVVAQVQKRTPEGTSPTSQTKHHDDKTSAQALQQPTAAMRSPHPIPFYYRLPLLYLEPLFALNGAYLLLSSPLSFLAAVSTNPPPASSPTSSQLLSDVRIITDQLGILHLVFAFNLAVVLRSTRDLRIWRLMCAGMLISDVLHILAQARELGWDRCWEPMGWRASDWANLGVLWWMGLTRLGVVAGWGIGYT